MYALATPGTCTLWLIRDLLTYMGLPPPAVVGVDDLTQSPAHPQVRQQRRHPVGLGGIKRGHRESRLSSKAHRSAATNSGYSCVPKMQIVRALIGEGKGVDHRTRGLEVRSWSERVKAGGRARPRRDRTSTGSEVLECDDLLLPGFLSLSTAGVSSPSMNCALLRRRTGLPSANAHPNQPDKGPPLANHPHRLTSRPSDQRLANSLPLQLKLDPTSLCR